MIDHNISGQLSHDQLVNLMAHIVRCDEIRTMAVERITLDDFDSTTELLYRLIFVVSCELHLGNERLVPRELLELECVGRLQNWACGALSSPEWQQQARGLIEYIYRLNLHPDYAKDLLQRFIWGRQVEIEILCEADKSRITPALAKVFEKGLANADFDLAGADLARAAARIQLADPETFRPATFISTGYRRLNGVLGGGLALGEMTTLVGPSGMGKSSYMVNLAVNIAVSGRPVLVVSLEMRKKEIFKLAVGLLGKIPRLHIRTASMTPHDQAAFQPALERLAASPLYVLDRTSLAANPNSTGLPVMATVEKAIRNGVQRQGIQVVFIDYLAKVGPHGDEETRRMATLNDWAFSLAQSTGVHLVAIAQQNKASFGNVDKRTKERTVGLQDVRGVIESVADADNVMALVRDDWNTGTPKDPVEMKVVLLKARQGPGGTAPMRFHRSTGLIEEVTCVSDA